jgi:hypothetical protein
VVGDPHSPSEHSTVTDHHPARKPYLPAEQAVHSNLNVVANHHEVIDLGSVTDTCRLRRAAVDGGQCANLDIIADLSDRPGVDLLQFVALRIGLSRAAGASSRFERTGARWHKAEPVRTDRRVMVKDGAVSHAASPANANAG